ncbi:MAG TPA: antitoxin [Candidatus Kapabacteria bacterium]|nr:antitoxin [Candidatus Kapabacteria bacterium]
MGKRIDKNKLALLDDPEEEREILEAYEKGLLEPVDNPEKRREELRRYAKATISKTKNVNVRLSERDFIKIKAKAIEIGIPYQALMGSLLHQYATGRISSTL